MMNIESSPCFFNFVKYFKREVAEISNDIIEMLEK